MGGLGNSGYHSLLSLFRKRRRWDSISGRTNLPTLPQDQFFIHPPSSIIFIPSAFMNKPLFSQHDCLERNFIQFTNIKKDLFQWQTKSNGIYQQVLRMLIGIYIVCNIALNKIRVVSWVKKNNQFCNSVFSYKKIELKIRMTKNYKKKLYVKHAKKNGF